MLQLSDLGALRGETRFAASVGSSACWTNAAADQGMLPEPSFSKLNLPPDTDFTRAKLSAGIAFATERSEGTADKAAPQG